ncbi:terminase small subunit [Planctomycetota bacterium]
MARPKFSDKHRTFCELYVQDFDRAGSYQKVFKTKNRSDARKNAHRLMTTNDDVRRYISQLLDGQTERADKKADDIIRELEVIAFSRITDYLKFGPDGVVLFDSESIDSEKIPAIGVVQERTTRRKEKKNVTLITTQRTFKLNDKIKALDKLGQHHRLWNDDNKGQPVGLFMAISEALNAKGSRRKGHS